MRDFENLTAKTITDYTGMIVIHGDLFEFDKGRTLLIDHTNPSNTCRIMDLLETDAVKGAIDVHSRKLSNLESLKELYGDQYEELVKVNAFSIPRAVIFKGDTLTESMVKYYNDQSIQDKSGYIIVDEQLNKRLNGELPQIELYGVNYLIDIHACKLNPVTSNHPPLQFHSSALTEPSEIFYNKLTNKQTSPPAHGQEFPSDVVALQFPPLSHLDIIGYAKMAGLSPTALACDFHWKPDSSKIQKVDLSQPKKINDSLKNIRVKEKSQKSKQKRRRKRAGIGGKSN